MARLRLVFLAAFALCVALVCSTPPKKASSTVCTIPYTFVTATTINAAPFNSNFQSLQTCANNIDNTNIGPAGIFASQIIPTTIAQATFGGTYPYIFPGPVAADGASPGASNVGFHGGNNTRELLLQSHTAQISSGGVYNANMIVLDAVNGNPSPIPTGPNAGNVAICLNLTRGGEAAGLFSVDCAGDGQFSGGLINTGPIYDDIPVAACPGPYCFITSPGIQTNGLHLGYYACPYDSFQPCSALVQSITPANFTPMMDLDMSQQTTSGTNRCLDVSRVNETVELMSIYCNGNEVLWSGSFLDNGPIYADQSTAGGNTANGVHAGTGTTPALFQSLTATGNTMMELDAFNQTSSNTNTCLNVTRNNGATALFGVTCAGNALATGSVAGQGHNTCSTSSGTPCSTALQCALYSVTTCFGTAVVPSGSVCVLTASGASDTTTGVHSWKASVSGTTLTGTITTASAQTSTAYALAVCE